VLISNCPQLNNPCNAYNPTPVQVLTGMGREVMFAGPDRKPWSDCLPNHSNTAQDGRCSVAVYSQADRHSPARGQADEAVFIGPPPPAQSYLSIPTLLEARAQHPCGAIHPGYGFLSENAEFAEACRAHGIVFIGPTPEQMRDFGLKHVARRIAAENGVPLLPGSGLLENIYAAVEAADRIGYPVMLKSTAGGGGIGIRLCASPAELHEAFDAARATEPIELGSGGLYLERFVSQARHIEVQIFAMAAARCRSRRARLLSTAEEQKVIEETPAPRLGSAIRQSLCRPRSAWQGGKLPVGGTVEFIYDNGTGDFYFLEVNTRLQVEQA